MKTLITIIVLMAVHMAALAQAPAIAWQKMYGGTGDDGAKCIQQTTDGGYIVAGYTLSADGNVTPGYGGGDYWIVKLNAAGSISWQKALGGTGFDVATAIQQTADGGYIVAGFSYSNDGDVTGNHGSSDFWLVKLSGSGSIEWQKSYGGSYQDEAASVQQTIDGGYIVCGNTASSDGDVTLYHAGSCWLCTDFWVIKISSTGILEWEKALGGGFDDIAYSVRQTADGGYVVAGWTDSPDGDITGNHGNKDYWVVKISLAGAIQWQRTYGGSSIDEAHSIIQTHDGGYMVAGHTASSDGDVGASHIGWDFWLIKLNDTGAIQWQKSYGGNYVDEATSIEQTTDGGYIVAGYTQSDDLTGCIGTAGSSYLAIKLSSVGSVEWQKCIGGNGVENATCIKQTPDEGYIISGGSKSDDIAGYHSGWDYFIVKLAGSTGVNPIDSSTSLAITIIPNPTTGEISINGLDTGTILIYDIVGRLTKAIPNTGTITIADVPAGVYFIKLFNEHGNMVHYDKIIKQ